MKATLTPCLVMVLAACAAHDGEPDDTTAAPEPDGAMVVRDLEPVPSGEALAPNQAAAKAMAAACGCTVPVASERTEYSDVYVDPSGNHTIVTAVVPQRARRLDGTWGPIDTTLMQVGDAIAPVASAAHVRFSAGGSGPFVTLEHDGHRFSLSWPDPLPAPTLAAD